MNVWRIHIKNDYEEGLSRKELFDFCIANKLIGVGWTSITTRVNSEAEIKKQAADYENSSAAIKALNAMRSMRIGDLIWTRLDGIYYLCRVTNLWENSKPTDLHNKFDISNYVNVEWLEIGMEDVVPGKVVSSFRPAASAQKINGVENITKYIWNKYSTTSDYTVSKEKLNIWNVLSDKSIEELVLLYLQVEKGYYIFSQTMKLTTREYECTMINSEGVLAFPQVKSGSVELNADYYMDAIKRNSNAQIYLFTACEKYVKNDSPNVHYIMKKELEEFMKKKSFLLPELTYNWLDICDFFS